MGDEIRIPVELTWNVANQAAATGDAGIGMIHLILFGVFIAVVAVIFMVMQTQGRVTANEAKVYVQDELRHAARREDQSDQFRDLKRELDALKLSHPPALR
jgi:hypothetical protein